MRLLLIEDEDVLGDAVVSHLKKTHAVDWMQTCSDGENALRTVDYDMVLLDLRLPDGNGLDLLKTLRGRGDARPVIILTAQNQISERIAGLNAGADDYLVKPFDLGELSARIDALRRRSSNKVSPLLKFGDIEVDQSKKSVVKDGNEIALTSREWALFEYLVQNLNVTVSKARLEEVLYSFGAEVESNAVEVYISRLRKKLGNDVIQTHRGFGYRMER